MSQLLVKCGGLSGWRRYLVLRSKTKAADYHDEMNSEHFMEWITEQLLSRLEEPCVIILDNASYHNKQRDKPPTSNEYSAMPSCGPLRTESH